MDPGWQQEQPVEALSTTAAGSAAAVVAAAVVAAVVDLATAWHLRCMVRMWMLWCWHSHWSRCGGWA